MDDGQEGQASKDERFEEYLHDRYQLFVSRDALPWSCGIRVRNGVDDNWYAPVLPQGIPIKPAPNFARRLFMTPSRLLKSVSIEIWRGDASVETTTDRRLKVCDQFRVSLREEVPARTLVWIKMELDESGCDDHCESYLNKIYAPMKICLFEARKGVLLGKKHWHLNFEDTGRSSGSPGQVAPWVGLEVLMYQALSWLEKWEGIEEEEAVVTWLYRAEQVMRKQDELWLRHVLDVLLVELRRQPGLSELLLRQTLSNIEDDNLRAKVQAESSYLEALRVIFSSYESRSAERLAGDAESVTNLDVVVSLLRAIIAKGDDVDNAANEFARIVRMMVSGDPEERAGGVRSSHRARAAPAALSRVRLLRDTFRSFVSFVEAGSTNIPTAPREGISKWIRSATRNLEFARPEKEFTELLELLRRWPITGEFFLEWGFLLAVEATSPRLGSQDELNELASERDDFEISEAAERIYQSLYQLYVNREQAGYVSDEEGVFLLVFSGVMRPNREQVVMEHLLAAHAAGELISVIADPSQPTLSSVEEDTFLRDLVAGELPRIKRRIRWRHDVPSLPEHRPDYLHRERDEDILSLVPRDRGWREPGSPVGDEG